MTVLMDDQNYAGLNRWYRDVFTEGSFIGRAGGPVRYAFQENKKKDAIVLAVSGRTEFLEKYLELSHDLEDLPCTFCLYDHFGQGGSGRFFENRQKGHIDDFQTYVDDLDTLINILIDKTGARSIHLLSHSMGGPIAALCAVRKPSLISSIILSSPMFQINSGHLSPFLAECICRVVCFFGGRDSYIWGTGDFDPHLDFVGNDLTHDKTRFTRNLRLMAELDHVALGGPTFGWLSEAYSGMRRARQYARHIHCPVLLLHGLADKVVGLEEVEIFASSVKNSRLVTFPEARHELFSEHDLVRNEVLAEIRHFIRSFQT